MLISSMINADRRGHGPPTLLLPLPSLRIFNAVWMVLPPMLLAAAPVGAVMANSLDPRLCFDFPLATTCLCRREIPK